MLFSTLAEFDEAIECVKTYQPGNPEAEKQASNFADRSGKIDELRGLCLIVAAPGHVFVNVGTRVSIVDRSSRVIRLKLLSGEKSGAELYAPPGAVSR